MHEEHSSPVETGWYALVVGIGDERRIRIAVCVRARRRIVCSIDGLLMPLDDPRVRPATWFGPYMSEGAVAQALASSLGEDLVARGFVPLRRLRTARAKAPPRRGRRGVA
jgi:hypothetical protein